MTNPDKLRDAVIEQLKQVIDPETNTDVIRMRLVQDLTVDAGGKAAYIFRPSSPLCPIAVPLALSILKAVGDVQGVTGQHMTVVDYVGADELNQIINTIFA
ncbi:MAG: iron-sulfur cluster assembly protein [Chloroflexi bacterium]|nr:iron-sulfur cluster assembly protein [Chloroflexota bacterium]